MLYERNKEQYRWIMLERGRSGRARRRPPWWPGWETGIASEHKGRGQLSSFLGTDEAAAAPLLIIALTSAQAWW
jgi:hypothetical protein